MGKEKQRKKEKKKEKPEAYCSAGNHILQGTAIIEKIILKLEE